MNGWNISCIRYVKDTILKAIYNYNVLLESVVQAVFDMSKIQFWKQFTTGMLMRAQTTSLYSICQRYNFESNLQHSIFFIDNHSCCIRYVKDTILKAIYNRSRRYGRKNGAVFDMSKIQFWKQFTTHCGEIIISPLLYSICQRYNFESNLQPRRLRIKYFFSCIRYVKDTILKAIYNISVYMLIYVIAVFDMSKIQY